MPSGRTCDPDGYTITTDYDVFDRPIRRTYPDETDEAMTYDRLDLVSRRNRLGRITRYVYDALRQLLATRDPLGRTITQDWCACGSLDALIDAYGNKTTWERDVQGRVTREVRAPRRSRRLPRPVSRRCRMGTILRAMCWNAAEHSLGADVLIDVRPMHPVAIANELPIGALGRRRVRQPPRPRQGHADHTPIDQVRGADRAARGRAWARYSRN